VVFHTTAFASPERRDHAVHIGRQQGTTAKQGWKYDDVAALQNMLSIQRLKALSVAVMKPQYEMCIESPPNTCQVAPRFERISIR
jgi:hypothetical protein